MGPEIGGGAGRIPQLSLDALLGELGFDPGLPGERDDRELWAASRELTGADAKALPRSAIEALASLWPGHLKAEVFADELREVDLLEPDLHEPLAGLADGTRYDLRLRLEKGPLTSSLGQTVATTRLFVTRSAWARVVASPYANVERELFGPNERTVVVIPGEGIDLIGPAIRICSFDMLPEPVELHGTEPSLASALGERRAEINANLTFCQLTPLHWEADGTGWGESAGDVLARMAVHSAALYTADRVTRTASSGVVIAEYAGVGGPVEVTLDGSLGGGLRDATVRAAIELIRWTYDPEPEGSGRAWSKERLSFTRIVMHERLRALGPADRSVGLAGAMVGASGELGWHWRTFVSGEIEKHSAAVRDFKDVVSNQAVDFAERTADLTNGVLDAMKAAVAAVLGSFIGAALSDSFNATVFRIGLVAYSAYLILFAGVLGVGSAILRYRASADGYGSQRNRAVGLLGAEVVEDLEGSLIQSNKEWFKRAIAGTGLLYACVLAAAAWAIVEVPGIVEGESDPTVLGVVNASLSETRPTTEWPIGGIDHSGTLRAAIEGAGRPAQLLTVTATGPRLNTCSLLNPETGDGFLVRDPGDEDVEFLVTVVRGGDGVDLRVVEVRGPTGLNAGPRSSGCVQLGEVGIDWTEPDWATE